MNTDKLLTTHSIVVNETYNGGESLTITTKFYGNGDPITENDGVYINQFIELQSYGNSASFNLFGASLTPAFLRRLANELESARNLIKDKN